MLIAQISDTHITIPGGPDKNSELKLSALDKCIDSINLLDPMPDAVIHTGDLSHNGTLDELKLVKDYMDRLNTLYFVTPGNRDCSSTMLDVFAERIGDRELSTNIIYEAKDFPAKLVSFDTTSPEDNLGVITFDKIASLDSILCKDQETPTIIFSHHPPFFLPDTFSPNIEYRSKNAINLFNEIIDRHPQIVALFCGHSHKSLRQDLGMFDASVAPPLCGLLNNSDNDDKQSLLGSYQLHKFNDKHIFTTEEKVLEN